jgi:hypothetical protein
MKNHQMSDAEKNLGTKGTRDAIYGPSLFQTLAPGKFALLCGTGDNSKFNRGRTGRGRFLFPGEFSLSQTCS